MLYACDDPSTWLPDDHRMWNAGEETSDPAVRVLRLDAFFAQPPSARAQQPGDWHWNGLNRSPYADALEGGSIARGRQNEYLIADTLRGRTVPGWVGLWKPAAGFGMAAHMQAATPCNSNGFAKLSGQMGRAAGSNMCRWRRAENIPGIGPERPSTCGWRNCPIGCTSLPSALNRTATAFMPTRSG